MLHGGPRAVRGRALRVHGSAGRGAHPRSSSPAGWRTGCPTIDGRARPRPDVDRPLIDRRGGLRGLASVVILSAPCRLPPRSRRPSGQPPPVACPARCSRWRSRPALAVSGTAEAAHRPRDSAARLGARWSPLCTHLLFKVALPSGGCSRGPRWSRRWRPWRAWPGGQRLRLPSRARAPAPAVSRGPGLQRRARVRRCSRPYAAASW
jgi:hypothetical protein